MTTALTASAARNRPPRYSALRSGEVKSSGSIPTSTSRTAASPKSAAVTSMPMVPTSADPPASRSGALAKAPPPSVGGGKEHPGREHEQEPGVDPGRRAAEAVLDLVAEDFAQLHGVPASPTSPYAARRVHGHRARPRCPPAARSDRAPCSTRRARPASAGSSPGSRMCPRSLRGSAPRGRSRATTDRSNGSRRSRRRPRARPAGPAACPRRCRRSRRSGRSRACGRGRPIASPAARARGGGHPPDVHRRRPACPRPHAPGSGHALRGAGSEPSRPMPSGRAPRGRRPLRAPARPRPGARRRARSRRHRGRHRAAG